MVFQQVFNCEDSELRVESQQKRNREGRAEMSARAEQAQPRRGGQLGADVHVVIDGAGGGLAEAADAAIFLEKEGEAGGGRDGRTGPCRHGDSLESLL